MHRQDLAFPWWEGSLGAVSGVKSLMPGVSLLRQCLPGEAQSPKPVRGCCVTLEQGAGDTEVTTASHPAGFTCRMWKCSRSALLICCLLLGLLHEHLEQAGVRIPALFRVSQSCVPFLCRSLPFPPMGTASTTWWATPGSGHQTGGLCTTPPRTSTTL